MFTNILLVLSICTGAIFLTIHNRDEIHQMVAFLSWLIALVCIFILTPPIIKGILLLLFLTIGHKIIPTYGSFK